LVKRPPFRVIALKPCGFCGARVKLSEEHIFADWLAPYLPDIGPAGHTTSQRMHRIPGPKGVAALKMKPLTVKAKSGILQGRRKPVKSSSLKIVCERCNNGWMSRVQDQVKPILLPMLHGLWPTEISRWDRRILAAWATMFTMVIEFADPGTQATTFPDREKFRLNPEPPAGWHVWVGLHSGPLWKLGYTHFGWLRPIFSDTDEEAASALRTFATTPKEAQSTGWVLGPLYFQTFSSNIAEISVDQVAFAKTHGLTVLWPSTDLTISRPTKVLDDIEADNASAALLPNPSRNGLRRAWEIW
jgi:hypothetical protein